MMQKTFFSNALLMSAIVVALCASVQAINGMGRSDDRYYQFIQAKSTYDETNKKVYELEQAREAYNATVDAAARTAILRRMFCSDLEGLEALIKDQRAALDNCRKMLSGKQELKPEQAFFRSFAGNDFYYDDSGIKNLPDALYKGMICAVSKETGEFLRTKIRGVLQDQLGVVFDTLVNGISDAFSRYNEIVFHDGYRPFDDDKLVAWQTHINFAISKVEEAIKNYQKSISSGQDMTMRSAPAMTDPDADVDGLENSFDVMRISTEQKKIQIFEQVWPQVFGGPVMRFAYFSAKILEERKHYYGEDSDVYFFANQIQQTLKQISLLLMCVTSDSDVDNFLGPKSAAIANYRLTIDSLFKILLEHTKRRTYTGGTSTSSQSYLGRQKPARDEDDLSSRNRWSSSSAL